MNDYIRLRINATPCDETITDLLAAFLADEGYESFEPDCDGLTAYIRAEDYSSGNVAEVLEAFPIETSFSTTDELVPGQDWNEEWERHYFQPIIVADKCVVHSTFHKDVPEADIDIVIDPKMAFGTGHHSTTCLMMGYILDLGVEGKSVIDMGTGTGILSILACKLGASHVTGIEIDPPAWENAIANCSLNDTEKIVMLAGDASRLAEVEEADFFLANINRNIITGDISRYAEKLKVGGTMLLSGFYSEDVPVITEAAAPYGLSPVETRLDNNWAAVRLEKRK